MSTALLKQLQMLGTHAPAGVTLEGIGGASPHVIVTTVLVCDQARFTGYQIDGGYADYTSADQRYCFPIPAGYADTEAAPLLCAGLIGYRALVMAGDAQRLGIYGFGAAARIIAQVARHQGRQVYAFTRPGDAEGQQFAHDLGAVWVGSSDTLPP
jgi:propanol-preferring alcohol dehydrogenase